MLINKFTNGYVKQIFNTEKKQFIHQEFVAENCSEYEDEQGDCSVDPSLLNVDGKEMYLPYDMVQPQDMS
jgi:hypothetical protein